MIAQLYQYLCCVITAILLSVVAGASAFGAEPGTKTIPVLKASTEIADGKRSLPNAKNSLPLNDQEKAWLSQHQTIKVAFDGYFPPYSFLNDAGKIEGLAVDILRVLAERTGITIEISPKTIWKDLYGAAQKREVDVVATMGRQPEREQWFVFTQPYIFKSMVIMTRSDNAVINRPEDLAGKQVALVQSYQYVKSLLDLYPSIRPFYVDTMLDGLNDVAVGKVDAAITFLGAGHYLKNKYQIANLKFAAIYDRDRFTESIAVRKDWPELASILDKALESVSSHEMLSLQEKWLPEEDIGIKKVFLTDKEKDWIRDHPVIRVGVNPELAPYAYIAEDGTFSGIASDYIRLLNMRLGLNMQVVSDLTWKDVVEKVRLQEIDVLPGIAVDEDRNAFLVFSDPFVNFYRVIITRKDTHLLTGVEDIRGLRVAVQADTAYEAYLKEYTDIKPLSHKTLQQALLSVSTGKADALFHNLASATFWISTLSLTNLKVAAPMSVGSETLHIAVRKDWPELLCIINKGLATIRPEEKVNILRRWVSVEYTSGIAPRTVFIYLTVVLGLVLLAALGFTIWNRALKREVDRKTEELQQELVEHGKTEELLRASESTYRRLHDSMMDGFAYVDMQGKMLDFNESFQTMLGYSSDEISRLTYRDITPEQWHESELQIIKDQVIARGYSDVYEKEYIRQDGGVFPVELRTFLIKSEDGKNEGMGAIVRDISERKQAEQELEKHREHLEDMVKERTADLRNSQYSLKNMVGELEEKTRKLERFNKLFVDREFRIKELKEKIKALEKHMESTGK